MRFDFHIMSKRSPTMGIVPVSVSIPMLATMRIIATRGNPRCQAAKTIRNDSRPEMMSPKPGTSPTMGSSPKRILVPGM